MIKGNNYSKPRGLLFAALAVMAIAGIVFDRTGVLALVGLGAGIGFFLGTLIKG